MAKTVADVMTKNPVAMSSDSSVVEAAKAMSDFRIGSVVVMTDSKLEGIVSLGDLTSRGMGEDVQDDLSKAEPNN